MKHRILAALAFGLIATVAHAADPTAVITSSSAPRVTFQEYLGGRTVGEGLIDIDTLFYIDEQSGPQGKSWYVFFEPVRPESVSATITFDGVITGVFTTKAELDGSNATYGAPGITYGTSLFIGLEQFDTLSFSANQSTLTWHSYNPGDHIRVFTTSPVPEPSTTALLAGGLMALGYAARRRGYRV